MDNNNNKGKTWAIAVTVLIVAVIVGLIWWTNRDSGQQASNGSQATTTTSSMILPYGDATLGIDETGTFSGISITPKAVIEDSRCPSKVQCIQAGTVRIRVASSISTGASLESTLKLGDAPTTIGGFSVALTAVSPYPQNPGSIAASAYRFTFRVHQSVGDNEGLEGKG